MKKEKKITNKEVFEELERDFQELLKKYDAIVEISLDFPEYKILPVDVQLAKEVLSKHTNRFLLSFKKANNDN